MRILFYFFYFRKILILSKKLNDDKGSWHCLHSATSRIAHVFKAIQTLLRVEVNEKVIFDPLNALHLKCDSQSYFERLEISMNFNTNLQKDRINLKNSALKNRVLEILWNKQLWDCSILIRVQNAPWEISQKRNLE